MAVKQADRVVALEQFAPKLFPKRTYHTRLISSTSHVSSKTQTHQHQPNPTLINTFIASPFSTPIAFNHALLHCANTTVTFTTHVQVC
jgi:hypothetical protein